MGKLKEELKQEILAELRQQGEIPEQDLSSKIPESAQEQVCKLEKVETEHDLSAKIESQFQIAAKSSTRMADDSVPHQPSQAGKAEGYIFRSGIGLNGCKVKLVRVLTSQSTIAVLSAIREGTEFVTITDQQGKYVFDRLPVGSYKLKWQLPGDKGWIRRLRDRPDAVISKGQTTIVKAVETNRRLAGS
jgi:hypothetical protein